MGRNGTSEPRRRLKLRRQVLRVLAQGELEQVVGGVRDVIRPPRSDHPQGRDLSRNCLG